MWTWLGRCGIPAALLAITLVLSGVSITDGAVVVGPVRVEAQPNWQCTKAIGAPEWLSGQFDECNVGADFQLAYFEWEWDEVRDWIECDDEQTGTNGNYSFYVSVRVETCDDVAPTSMTLRAYEYYLGPLVAYWDSPSSQSGAYVLTSGCYDSCNWPTYWEVELGVGSVIEYVDWYAGCCTCYEYYNPCS